MFQYRHDIQTARSARNKGRKRGGIRPRTEREIEKLNGEIKTIHLDQVSSWSEYKQLSSDYLKIAYLDRQWQKTSCKDSFNQSLAQSLSCSIKQITDEIQRLQKPRYTSQYPFLLRITSTHSI